MGGSRSGRWGSSKPFAEGLARLDLADCPSEVSLIAAARDGRVLEMKMPTGHGFDVTARIRFTLTPLHFGGCRVWMVCARCNGRAPRDIRRVRQSWLQALSSCSISVAMWGCERSCALGNRQDRAAPNHAAQPLLQAERNALAHVPSPLRSLRSSRCSVECQPCAGCPETRASIRAV